MEYTKLKSIFSILMLSLVLVGCPSDDDDVMNPVVPTPPVASMSNEMMVGTESYPLTEAYRSNTIVDTPGQLWETTMIITGDGIAPINGTLQGRGDILVIQFYTGTNTLTAGTYNLDIGNNPGEVYVTHAIDVDVSTATIENDVFGGTVELSINGNSEYTITIDGTEDNNGQSFDVFYDGVITLVN